MCHNKTVNKFIKLLAAWILVFALPMQGFAAATMVNCEKSHSHEAKSLTENHNHAMHSGHDEGTIYEATHEHVADTTSNHDTHHSSSSKHACTHCGSVCCSSTAIVATLPIVASHFDNSKTTPTYSAPQFTSFVSAGIERPPRSILV